MCRWMAETKTLYKKDKPYDFLIRKFLDLISNNRISNFIWFASIENSLVSFFMFTFSLNCKRQNLLFVNLPKSRPGWGNNLTDSLKQRISFWNSNPALTLQKCFNSQVKTLRYKWNIGKQHQPKAKNLTFAEIDDQPIKTELIVEFPFLYG